MSVQKSRPEVPSRGRAQLTVRHRREVNPQLCVRVEGLGLGMGDLKVWTAGVGSRCGQEGALGPSCRRGLWSVVCVGPLRIREKNHFVDNCINWEAPWTFRVLLRYLES